MTQIISRRDAERKRMRVKTKLSITYKSKAIGRAGSPFRPVDGVINSEEQQKLR